MICGALVVWGNWGNITPKDARTLRTSSYEITKNQAAKSGP